jgi:hypothetical protein
LLIYADKTTKEDMPPIHAALPGLAAAERRLERSADRLARAPLADGVGADSISLSEDALALMAARNAYEMNLQVLEVGDGMTKKLLDFLA